MTYYLQFVVLDGLIGNVIMVNVKCPRSPNSMGRYFFLLQGVQTSSASHPASHPSGTKSDVFSGKAAVE